jgi:hypothetical protein
MNRHCIAKGLRFLVWGAVAVTVFGFVVMSLWNWLMPSLFGWRLVNFWQAVGLVILSRILFGGFRGHPGGSLYWRRRMMERWERMAPEEREKFRAGLREHCGRFEPPPKPTA